MSGPRRLNALTGFAFVNLPTAAAVRASGSCGASFAAAANCCSAESGRWRPQSAVPYRSFAWASGFAAARASAASSSRRRQLRDRARRAEVEHEVRQGRQARKGQLRVQEILRLDPVRRVGADLRGLLPLGDGVGVLARPVVRDAQVEQRQTARRMRGREALQRREPGLLPRGEGRADLRLQRSGSGRRSRQPAPRGRRCRAPAAPLRARASALVSTPKLRSSGGSPARGFTTAFGTVVRSPRVWSSVAPTTAAAAISAASATMTTTRRFRIPTRGRASVATLRA